MTKVAVPIDGGHLRVLARNAKLKYGPDLIERVAHACVGPDERLLRVLYYDCPPFNGVGTLPVSGKEKAFTGSDAWLRTLAAKDLFAVRLGVLKFRGFKPKKVPIAERALTDDDFQPDFEQKGVDMRIGLDIASFSEDRKCDRIVLITNDTDCIPAMKHGRKAGLQIVLARFSNSRIAQELLWHADFSREVPWPA
jgi:uncharacterized LabA/DUF88 family protein